MEDLRAPLLEEIKEELDPLEDISALIKEAIAEEPPLAMKEGGIIRDGYSEEVDTSAPRKIRRKGLACKAGDQKNGKRPGSKI